MSSPSSGAASFARTTTKPALIGDEYIDPAGIAWSRVHSTLLPDDALDATRSTATIKAGTVDRVLLADQAISGADKQFWEVRCGASFDWVLKVGLWDGTQVVGLQPEAIGPDATAGLLCTIWWDPTTGRLQVSVLDNNSSEFETYDQTLTGLSGKQLRPAVLIVGAAGSQADTTISLASMSGDWLQGPGVGSSYGEVVTATTLLTPQQLPLRSAAPPAMPMGDSFLTGAPGGGAWQQRTAAQTRKLLGVGTLVDAGNFGASPGASAAENAQAINDAIDYAESLGGGHVILNTPGVYAYNATLKPTSCTFLEFAPGVGLAPTGSFNPVICNKGFYTGTRERNISVVGHGTNIDFSNYTEPVDPITELTIPGQRSRISIGFCDGVLIRGLRLINYGAVLYGVGPNNCTDVEIEGCYWDGQKDAVHASFVDGLRVKKCRWKVLDDGVGCIGGDWSIGSAIPGPIRNVTIEDCVDMYRLNQTGHMVRFAPGSWRAGALGLSCEYGDIFVVSGGLYRRTNSGNAIVTAELPTHTTLWQKATTSDGITYVYMGPFTHTTADITCVRMMNNRTEAARSVLGLSQSTIAEGNGSQRTEQGGATTADLGDILLDGLIVASPYKPDVVYVQRSYRDLDVRRVRGESGYLPASVLYINATLATVYATGYTKLNFSFPTWHNYGTTGIKGAVKFGGTATVDHIIVEDATMTGVYDTDYQSYTGMLVGDDGAFCKRITVRGGYFHNAKGLVLITNMDKADVRFEGFATDKIKQLLLQNSNTAITQDITINGIVMRQAPTSGVLVSNAASAAPTGPRLRVRVKGLTRPGGNLFGSNTVWDPIDVDDIVAQTLSAVAANPTRGARCRDANGDWNVYTGSAWALMSHA